MVEVKKITDRRQIVQEINRIAEKRLKLLEKGEDGMSKEDWTKSNELQDQIDQYVDMLLEIDNA